MSAIPKIAVCVLLTAACASAGGTTIRWEPEYPDEALQNCVEGEVTLKYEVGPEALPINIEVVSSDPEGMFDAVAVKALSRWHQEGAPGDIAEETVEFRIDDHSECDS